MRFYTDKNGHIRPITPRRGRKSIYEKPVPRRKSLFVIIKWRDGERSSYEVHNEDEARWLIGAIMDYENHINDLGGESNEITDIDLTDKEDLSANYAWHKEDLESIRHDMSRIHTILDMNHGHPEKFVDVAKDPYYWMGHWKRHRYDNEEEDEEQ